MYSWSFYEDCESFDNDNFEGIKECIEDAKRSWKAIGYEPTYNKIYIGQIIPIQIKNLVNFFEVLEHVEINMAKETPYAEDWDISTIRDEYIDKRVIYDKYDKKLEQLVENYIKEIGETPHFSTLKGIRELDLLDYMSGDEIADMNRVIGNVV